MYGKFYGLSFIAYFLDITDNRIFLKYDGWRVKGRKRYSCEMLWITNNSFEYVKLYIVYVDAHIYE